VRRPAQRTQGSIPENQFRRPRPGLHGGRLTEILEPLPKPRETSTAPAREDEHRAAGSPGTRPRWTEIRSDRAPRRRTVNERSTGEPCCTRTAPPLLASNHHQRLNTGTLASNHHQRLNTGTLGTYGARRMEQPAAERSRTHFYTGFTAHPLRRRGGERRPTAFPWISDERAAELGLR
jgi:hypothetical protein